MQIKVKTFLFPSFDKYPDNFGNLESDIEKFIKNKLESGWILSQSIGGDGYVLLIFSKE